MSDGGGRLIEGEFVGHYRIGRQIYKGDYACIFRATQVMLDRQIALKIQNPSVPEEIPDAMVREGRLQAGVQHRNVLALYDGFEVDERVILALEFVRTQSLADLLEHRTLPLRAALGVFRGIVRGVRALHVCNIVHRDLKPENILLAKDEGRVVPKICDFGLAKLLEPDVAPKPQHLSEAFTYLGTPEYMAPEQGRDPGRVDTRADMFSLGCILYELVTHRVCFDAKTPVEAMYKAAKTDYLPVHAVVPTAPATLSEIVASLVAADPANRLADCDLLLQRLDSIRT